jgi:hypothetical protein
MALAVSCPRCGGAVRPPGLAHSHWTCLTCGDISPLHSAVQVTDDLLADTVKRAAHAGLPLWCPWPMPTGWLVTGLGWVGDERSGALATAVACTGPTPLGEGPADIVLVAEDPGVGLGTCLAGLAGPDVGPALDAAFQAVAHATVKAAGRSTPLWSVSVPEDRSAYAGEAKGRWIYAVCWPAHAGYLLFDGVVLHDLTEWTPPELVFGAPSRRLHPADTYRD